MTTGVNSVFVLGYSGAIMVPLGWIGGVVGLLLSTLVSLYASCLIAKLHEFGDKRHIRYRDLARYIYGMDELRKARKNDFSRDVLLSLECPSLEFHYRYCSISLCLLFLLLNR